MKKKRKKIFNKDCKNVRTEIWNPWGMGNELLNYCKSFNYLYDILGLPELHNVHNKERWKGKHWITSEDARIDEQGKKRGFNIWCCYLTFKTVSEIVLHIIIIKKVTCTL